MARQLTEIQQIIFSEKDKHSELSPLSSTSKVAIWRLWVYVVAFVVWTLEMIFDSHKTEVLDLLSRLKPHTARWYREKALAFQFGFDLIDGSDIFEIPEGTTDEQINLSKIVKYAAVVEAESESRLVIKIAAENAEGILSPISPQQQESFSAYMNEIRDAGVKITVINYLPDRLYLNITIKRDALVLDQNGTAILTALNPVEAAIAEFLKELPFNGELILSKLTDKIQAVEGVLDVFINSAQTSWIDANSQDYGATENIFMSKIPVSGYFTTKNTDGNNLVSINYIV